MSGAFAVVQLAPVFPVRTRSPLTRALALALVVSALLVLFLVLVLVVGRGLRRCVPEGSNEALCSAPPSLSGPSRGAVISASGP